MFGDTKETFTQMFDSMAGAAKASVDAGRQFQEAWLANSEKDREGSCGPFAALFDWSKQMGRAWSPFVANGASLVADCATDCLHTNAEAVKTFAEKGAKAKGGSFACKPTDVWSSAFDAIQANFATINKAGSRAMDNWTGFCRAACVEQDAGKATSKVSK